MSPLDAPRDTRNSDLEADSDEEGGPPSHRLPAWRPVALDSAAGAAPARARAPQLHILANPAPDTSCLQLDGGLCATGASGADGQVHLWSTEDDELEFKRSLAGHPQGVATLSFQVGPVRFKFEGAGRGPCGGRCYRLCPRLRLLHRAPCPCPAPLLPRA